MAQKSSKNVDLAKLKAMMEASVSQVRSHFY